MHNSTSTSQKPLSERTPSNVTRALLGIIRTYQHLRAGRIAPCRFYPSCSDYAAEAIRLFISDTVA